MMNGARSQNHRSNWRKGVKAAKVAINQVLVLIKLRACFSRMLHGVVAGRPRLVQSSGTTCAANCAKGIVP